ncbi:hypothetical protein Desde_2907 [Desulfitobacterium dehalogenans ATCC 51507]|uniref:Uncharacterized protein n=1 Tax=Desulfitobacterium dehalogenans (strain ATCC 51507 / DSM 9161 / JW/IU-DC1) TaxID=756499 RepID=I4AB75_DESDJ|nr:hypothetical protein [Desulfitobacterium dehalogenans]AFM01210.1 hypothetical protein Desde_2907 [Desulfitobacterium dehalogenans ATCC 51507]
MMKSKKIILSILCIFLFFIGILIVKLPEKVPTVEVEMSEVLSNGQSKVIPPIISIEEVVPLWIREKETNLASLVADKMAVDRDMVRIHFTTVPDGDAGMVSCSVVLAVEQGLKEETLNNILDLIVEEASEAGTQQTMLRKEDIIILNSKNEIVYPGNARL